MRDFTIAAYQRLLDTLVSGNHTLQPYAEFLEKPAPRAIILRHDVEARYGNALAFAKIQHELGVRGTFGVRSAVSGRRAAVSGQRSAGGGQRSAVGGRRSAVGDGTMELWNFAITFHYLYL